MRCGVFCNPGAATKALKLSLNDVQRHHLVYHRKCGDEKDIIEGKPTGAIRISFGLSNTIEDVQRWINFLKAFFIPDNVISQKNEIFNEEKNVAGHLTDLKIYPIKSCGGYSASSWPIDIAGLSLDRNWRLVDENGNILTQKKFPAMALIRPSK